MFKDPQQHTPLSKGEGHLFMEYLGARWNAVHPHIQQRFSQNPSPEQPIFYNGEMSIVRCSWLGRCMAHSVQWTGALQPYKGTDVPVQIKITAEHGVDGVYKQRTYFFQRRKPFQFNSLMMLNKKGELEEYVGGGFGMKVHVEVKDGQLHFSDRGYFFKLGKIRFPLPYIFSPGDTYLLHKNLGKDSFQIIIRIHHRLFGEMFYQEGIFQHGE